MRKWGAGFTQLTQEVFTSSHSTSKKLVLQSRPRKKVVRGCEKLMLGASWLLLIKTGKPFPGVLYKRSRYPTASGLKGEFTQRGTSLF